MTDLTPQQLSSVSRLFSSAVVKELARKGRSPLFARLARESSLAEPLLSSGCVCDLFDAAYSLLSGHGSRDEYIYKAALTQRVLLGTHSLRTASMLTEFRVGSCKADVVILNGTATVYEVKSDRDSLSRLQRQVAAYGTVFGTTYVVVGRNHIDAVWDLIPESVGVLSVDGRNRVTTVRGALDRTDYTSPAAMFDSLRTVEARLILEGNGIPTPRVPNTELNSALRRLFVRLGPRQAHEGMVRVLKRTRSLLPLSTLLSELPDSLQTAALSVPLRRADHSRLVASVKLPLAHAMSWG